MEKNALSAEFTIRFVLHGVDALFDTSDPTAVLNGLTDRVTDGVRQKIGTEWSTTEPFLYGVSVVGSRLKPVVEVE